MNTLAGFREVLPPALAPGAWWMRTGGVQDGVEPRFSELFLRP
jgi:hypothetical protein